MEGTRARSGLSRSAALTHDHRWRTLATTILLWLIAVAVGPLVGGVLLLLTSLDFVQTNWIAGILLAILVPIAATGLGLQYFDLVARSKSDA
jgi:MFS family permease